MGTSCMLVYFCIPEAGNLANCVCRTFTDFWLTLEVLFQRQSLVPPTHYQLLHQALCGTGPCIGNASNGADRINVLTLMRQGGSLSRLAWEQRESHPRTVRVCAPVGRLAQILLIALDLHLSHNMSFQFFLISFVATFLIGLENT